jgi:L,D-transpeptidase ErfK/SrfK
MKRLITLTALLLLFLPLTATALYFDLPPTGEDVVGTLESFQTKYEDTLIDVGRLYDLGYVEMKVANPNVDPWLPGSGTEVVIPTQFILPPGPRKGVVINLPELRLYYYPRGGKEVITYPLGIGREGWSTPTGFAKVTGKTANPAWRPPASIRAEHEAEGDPLPEVVPAGPDNPLGTHALYLSMRGYLLHGTNKPYGVGMRVSHGCIRLYPEDIKELFSQLPVGTPVRIINEPYKAGWFNGRLYVEAHTPLSEQLQSDGVNLTPLIKQVVDRLGENPLRPDWSLLKQIAQEHKGIPIAVTPAAGQTVAQEDAINKTVTEELTPVFIDL